MAEEISPQAILADLATRLQIFNDQSNQVNAVSIKLPEFWTKSPEVWFARVEAQFGTKGINQDQTKYDYVVSALDINTAEEVQSILINPPTDDKYYTLKNALIKTFGKSQNQKDAELLNLHGLCDKRPTALLRKINALNNDPQTLKRALFLANLPSDVRSILAGHNIADTETLAEAADRIWESRTNGVQQVSMAPTEAHNTNMKLLSDQNVVTPPLEQAAFAIKKEKRHPPFSHRDTTSSSSVCFYHQRFGTEARRCQPGCKCASLLSRASNQGTSFSGNANAVR
eukprot:TRINITY_DN31880_c1_g1_i1.p1 TRINITY_DN31880_c1_g1~~TRINITY_DN31880_c1_g1_i1.p1  ORF type:complete len:285 (+),score=53.29 TRINITY_DN31880_c1_g1_i1:183-1037(+)